MAEDDVDESGVAVLPGRLLIDCLATDALASAFRALPERSGAAYECWCAAGSICLP
jgi:hypothetical protein